GSAAPLCESATALLPPHPGRWERLWQDREPERRSLRLRPFRLRCRPRRRCPRPPQPHPPCERLAPIVQEHAAEPQVAVRQAPGHIDSEALPVECPGRPPHEVRL